METSQSSQLIRDKQKPPIAKKPLIRLPPKKSPIKDNQEISPVVVSRRRCKSLHDELNSEKIHKARLSDSTISSNVLHIDSVICNNPQEEIQNEEMFSSLDDLLCERNDFNNSNKDYTLEESIPEPTNDSSELIDEISTKLYDIGKYLTENSNTSPTTDKHLESIGNVIENISKQNISENSEESDIHHQHQQEHLNEDSNSGEDSGNIPSSIPDILSDHVLPKSMTSTPVNDDHIAPLGSNLEEEDRINGDSGENEEEILRDPDNDDGGDELVDLTSRRAILRGHSIRLSRHQRHPSRLPSVADSSTPHRNVATSSPKDQPRNHLPKGWESRIDIHSRIFYIDHTNRTTTWKKPEASAIVPERNSVITDEDRVLMDKRYQSLRRSLRAGHVSDHGNANLADDESTTDQTNQPTPGNHGYEQKFDDVGDPILPGAMFLCRPDFFTLLQNNQAASDEYNRSSPLKHMVNKIRRDYSSFKELHHRKDLVAFVNHFSEPNRPFPDNWEMKQDRSNKSYYIDHNLKITTYIDPRLPPLPHFHADILRATNRSSISHASENPEGHQEYHDRVVLFLKQANILDILKTKYPTILSSMSLKNKVNMVRSEGQQAILKLKNDLELTVMLSVFEEEIMTYVAPGGTSDLQSGGSKHLQSHHRSPQKKRILDLKLNDFYARLEDRGFCKGNVKYRLIVRRDRILQDGYDKIMSLTKKELQRSKLVIAFKGEDGLDYGGPSREFFFLISRELFNPYYGLFAYSANDTYTVHVSPTSSHIDNYLGWFRFAGRIIALALIHQYLLDVFFTRVFYKQLLHLKPCLTDLESLDLEFYRSLAWINDKATADELESMGLTFSVTEEVEDDENEDSLDDVDFKREGRKGLLGWFDGIVKGRSYSDYERRRSKSGQRNPMSATSVININSTSYNEYGSNNLFSAPRRKSAHVHTSATTSTNDLNSRSNPNLINSASQSTEFISGVGEALPMKQHVPRITERDLRPNGKSISVTERNKKDYLERMIDWRVKRGTHKQMDALIHGFNEILEPKLISRFDAHELELVIAGSVEIDVQDWRMNTVYRSGYSDNHQVITWFWNVVASYDNDQRLRLLQFVTGTSSMPVEGFAALRGNTGPKKFCIEKWGKVTDLPRAHTCFNRLDLPPYTSYYVLLEKLTIAVEETSTFGIE